MRDSRLGAWQPSLGAWPVDEGTAFRVWAPTARSVVLVVDRSGRAPDPYPLERQGDGMFSARVGGVGAGDRYRYLVDGRGPFPDPASRYQPDGVHGPSLVVDARTFEWSDQTWSGVELADLVLYELHVGTFSAPGTFAGVAERLPYLKSLGVTAIELMPVADFPGSRNWGYDGVALFAPARCYGTPDDLRHLVNEAHRHGLAVILDVVYNHLGPDGAYLSVFSPYYFTTRHSSPWGAAVNMDGEGSAQVRAFFIENALSWIFEYHIDGLRLDATHAILDDSPRHFLAELSARVHESVARPRPLVIAEDHRNLAIMVRSEEKGGWGLDAVWADDFHHQVRRLLVGDAEGYYRDFAGTTPDLAVTLQQGWFFTGQWSTHLAEVRGTDPEGIPSSRFVLCLQNHDQIGNRAHGERLSHQIDAAMFRAVSALLLLAPHTPLVFMGQEWAATTPFLYFTDHAADLGRLVTEGRRREFQAFAAFGDEAARKGIPDPQAVETYVASRLRWEESEREPHSSMVRFYSAVLALRRRAAGLRGPSEHVRVAAPDDATLALRLGTSTDEGLLLVVRLRGGGLVTLGSSSPLTALRPGQMWVPTLTSEDAPYSSDPSPATVHDAGPAVTIHFTRPSAVVLEPKSVR